ncbi:MAG TPA: hypothetical protein VNO51_09695, partial [Ilumatobacteraceae bacterium]|nr:hypothetical protein [Ilumatobacteraceae bacterium]
AVEKIKGEVAAAQADADAAHDAELEKVKAQLAEAKAVLDQGRTKDVEQHKANLAQDQADLVDELAAESADAAQDRELRTLFHTKITDVASGAIDRSRDSAKFVQAAAAALMGAYTALLGLVFSVTGRTLPLRGVYSAVFLGVAIAMAVAYLAFLRQRSAINAYEPSTSLAETQLRRTSNFVEWMNAAVASGAWALRAAVIAFGIGVAFIPAAFVGPTSPSAPTAGAPEPPSIPAAVPEAIEEPALRLFEYEVDKYLASVEVTDPESPTAADVDTCSDVLSPFRSCGWTTETAVERSFRWLVLYSVLAISAVAILPGLVRWVRSK